MAERAVADDPRGDRKELMTRGISPKPHLVTKL
jgi:hypothetical protein